MRSLLGRFHRPFARGVDEQLLLLNNLGDGSTLSLDFTTGVLDPRLTFTRSTNATFINSQGYVEFAAANILRNSVMAGGSTSGLSAPTSWSAGATGESYRTQILIDGCEQWKQVASSQRPYMTITIPNTELAVGVQYVASVYVDSFTTGLLFTNLDNFFSYNEPTGTTVSSATWVAPNGSTGSSQPLAIGRIQLRFVLSAIGASGFQLRIGIGVQNTAVGTVEFSRPQCERGTVAKPFLANTSTSAANYNTPRFDYDPSTLQPRGLLIEGSASNVLQYSEAVDQSPWFTAGTVARATFTGGNGPNGVNNSGSKLSATSISSASSLYYNGLALTAQTYTMSVFAKADGANWIWVNIQQGATIHGAFFDLSGNGALGNTTGTVVSGSNIITKYPNGWFRIQFSFTGTASVWFPVLLPCTSNGTGYASIAGQAPNGVLVYGCQIETGSGASSYIPTGASTGSRAADSCFLTDFAGWSAGGNFSTTEGTLFVDQAVTFVGTANYPLGGFSTSNTAGSRFGWQYRQGDSPQGYRGLVNAGYVYELPSGAGWSIPAGTTRFRHAMSCGGGTSAFLRQSLKSSASTGAPTQNNYSDTSTLNISGVAAFTLTQSVFTASVRIARVKYWPRAFTLAELDALTN
jgi:hypothetical protein